MKLYLDASVVVTFLTLEAETGRVKDWLVGRPPEDLAISAWVGTEFLSALATKARLGVLSPEAASGAEARFMRLQDRVASVDFRPTMFADAGRFLSLRTTSLRAGDALHLAVAASASATLCTRERRFAEAATLLGRPVELI